MIFQYAAFRRPLAALLSVLLTLSAGAVPDDPWMYNETPMSNEAFLEQNLTAAGSSVPGSRSVFAWNLYLLNSGALPALLNALSACEINRVYQEIPEPYFAGRELATMVRSLARRGVQTVALNGDRDWVKDGLDEYRRWIDGLCQYNKKNPSNAIGAVALDVESYTLRSFRKDPAAGFAAYTASMREAYQYAHERGLRVIQVIPTLLDNIDRRRFEWFVQNCCDEITIMNYQKDVSLASIWNEVLTCRRLGVPVETIYETMPLDDYYSVTEEKTYFYDGREALAEAVAEMQSVYGASLGIGYHHYQTMYHLESGLYLAEIYPYAKEKSQGDENGQIKAGTRIRLKGGDGSTAYAWLYNPNLANSAAEYCYLAVGVKLDMDYTVVPDSVRYQVTSSHPLRFESEEGKLSYTGSFHAKRR